MRLKAVVLRSDWYCCIFRGPNLHLQFMSVLWSFFRCQIDIVYPSRARTTRILAKTAVMLFRRIPAQLTSIFAHDIYIRLLYTLAHGPAVYAKSGLRYAVPKCVPKYFLVIWRNPKVFRLPYPTSLCTVQYRVIQNDCRGTTVQREFRTKFGKKPPSDNSFRRFYDVI